MAEISNVTIDNLPSSCGNINSSLQVGDTLYWIDTQSQNGLELGGGASNLMGVVQSILPIVTDTYSHLKITFVVDDNGSLPSPGNFIYFTKSRAVNISSVTGYYGEVTFSNSSTSKAELFAASCDVVQSSK